MAKTEELTRELRDQRTPKQRAREERMQQRNYLRTVDRFLAGSDEDVDAIPNIGGRSILDD